MDQFLKDVSYEIRREVCVYVFEAGKHLYLIAD